MAYTVMYWNRAPEDVYEVIRRELPAGWTLRVPAGDGPAACRGQLADVDFVLTAVWPVGEEELRAAPRLRMVQHQGVGHDHIDKAALERRRIPLALCPAGTTIGVAEHTILLILAVYRRLVVADTRLRQGAWLQWALRATSFELAEKTVGLVGFGRIGQAVARRLHAFDARILYHDPYLGGRPPEADTWGARAVGLDDLLGRSDVVSLHVPAAVETRHLVGARELATMKSTAILINTSRGAVVDEPALVAALEGRTIAGAGLDVFEDEPVRADHPLFELDTVVLTPHIAAGTVDALGQKMRAVFANYLRFVEGAPIRDRVV
jgi:phosphoglycerate dehydrogenase-like enzyme